MKKTNIKKTNIKKTNIKNKKSHRLKPSELTTKVPSDWLPFRTTESLETHVGMIGQERAMRAVDFGLRIPTRGYNIFAVGEPGSGKTSTLERILKNRAQNEQLPQDICYVYNFKSPDRPKPVLLPAGQGKSLANDMKRITGELEKMVPRVLSDGSFGHLRSSIISETRSKADEITNRTSEIAEKLGLILEESDNVFRITPLYKGKPISDDKLKTLPSRAKKRIEEKIIEFQKHIDSFSYTRRQLERDHELRLKAAEMRAVTPLCEELLGEVIDRYKKHGKDIEDYLENAKQYAIGNHRFFINKDDAETEENEMENISAEDHNSQFEKNPKMLLHVNVIVDRSNDSGAPVIVERVPAASNLCGLFEYRETPGGLVTDHTMIRSGALHQANGGYLLIQASDLLGYETSWASLKRSLRHKEARIEEGMGINERPKIAGTLKPGAVPINVKVILIGSHELYYTFKSEDEDFQRLFKILADFAPSMFRTKENVMQLAQFSGQICKEENYLPLHKSGMIRIIEFASRRAENKERLITRRSEILDLLAEANMYARESGAYAIRSIDVEQSLQEQEYRHGAIATSVGREIDNGTILIQTKGSTVGQINGIALYDVAGTVFGTPVRITARNYAGRRGVVNIDREVNLSGAIHDKGALILIGYLGGRYAQNQALGFSASITFEQSYDEIDGDSASSAELYTLLSALSNCPINQGIAVTGSVNQLGEVQPIGGVNDKIEGVFEVCKKQGLTGNQGVMIPATNIRNLMLKKEVIEAVKNNMFSIYAISSIDEGIEVLTGVEAGRKLKNGTWTLGSINDRVQKQLAYFVDAIKVTPKTSYDKNL